MAKRTCPIDGCTRPVKTRGWCQTHYMRWWRGGTPHTTYDDLTVAPCIAPDCDRPRTTTRHCDEHAAEDVRRREQIAAQRRSAPNGRSVAPPEVRFWSRVAEDEHGCWRWQGGHDRYGYGVFSPHRGDCRIAHRYAYELMVGPIPDGLVIDHECNVRDCVNPYHLDPVTVTVNNQRRESRKRAAA